MTGSPRLLTKLVAPRWLPVVVFGMFLLLGIGLLVIVSARSSGELGHARVLGPAPDGHRVRLQVLDGPQPETWIVDFREARQAAVGEVIEVRLTGDCGCEPHPDFSNWVGLVLPTVIMAAIFGISVQSARSRSRLRSHQLQAAAAADLGVPVTRVQVQPSFSGRRVRSTRLWLEVSDAATGAPLGWLDLRLAVAGFDPSELVALIGHPVPGRAVALATADLGARALPVSPLLPTRAVPAAPWSELAAATLGWEQPAAEAVPVIGGDGRLSVATTAIPTATDELSSLARVHAARLRRTGRWPLGAYVVALVGSFFLPVPWNFVGIVAAIVGYAIWRSRLGLAQVAKEARRVAPGLTNADRAAYASTVLALIAPAPAGSTAVEEPGPAG